MRVPFVKMHGLGNDFVVLDARADAVPVMTSALAAALAEDIGSGDVTGNAVIPPTLTATLVMRARDALSVAGLVFLPELFALVDPAIRVEIHAAEGQQVSYGIRPGDLELTASGVPAKVVVVEPTGAETELLLQIGQQQLTLVLHGRTAAQPGDTVHLAIDGAKAHVFDGQGGQRL